MFKEILIYLVMYFIDIVFLLSLILTEVKVEKYWYFSYNILKYAWL